MDWRHVLGQNQRRGGTTPRFRWNTGAGGGANTASQIQRQNRMELKILKILKFAHRMPALMNGLSLIFLVLFLLIPGSVRADECAFLPKSKPSPDPEWASLGSSTPGLDECRALTDKARNAGKPLTLMQLEEVRTQLTKPHKKGTIWGKFSSAVVSRKVDCMILIGDIKTCHCLSENLPVFTSFSQYVLILTEPSALDAASLGITQTEFLKLNGVLWSVRDQCVTGR